MNLVLKFLYFLTDEFLVYCFSYVFLQPAMCRPEHVARRFLTQRNRKHAQERQEQPGSTCSVQFPVMRVVTIIRKAMLFRTKTTFPDTGPHEPTVGGRPVLNEPFKASLVSAACSTRRATKFAKAH